MIAKEIRAKGIDMIVIGVGKGVKRGQLVAMAGEEGNTYNAKSFTQLLDEKFVEKITKAACNACKGEVE